MVEIGFFTIIILIVNTLLSLWNAYSAGYNSIPLKMYKGKGAFLYRFANNSALVLSFAGLTYVLMFLFGFIGYWINYIQADILSELIGFNQLVFGGLITFTGIVVAIQSIVIAAKSRDWKSVLIAIFNSLVTIWNVYAYTRSFGYAFSTSKELFAGAASSNDVRIKVIVIILAAVITAFMIVYGFYKFGQNKAKKELTGVFGAYLSRN